MLFVARLGIAFLLLSAAVLGAVSLGIDRWLVVTADSDFFTAGVQKMCTMHGCHANNYSATYTNGACVISTERWEDLNRGSLGTQITGIVLAGLGAFVVAGSSIHPKLILFTAGVLLNLFGQCAYLIGGALAYYTFSSWVHCERNYCSNFYSSGGTYCLETAGPSFALWCIALAVGGAGFIAGVWVLAEDAKKAMLFRATKKTTPLSPARSPVRRQQSIAPVASAPPPEPVAAAPAVIRVPPGYVYDAKSELYYSESEGAYFDQRSGHFYSPQNDAWYNPETKQWYKID